MSIATYADALMGLPADLREDDVLDVDALRVFRDDVIDVLYAPFEHLNPLARVVIVGLAPGRFQVHRSWMVARELLLAGRAHDDVLRIAKSTASFAGPTRTNLIAMLDELGLADALGLKSTSSLYDVDAPLLMSTALVPLGVFVHGSNWTGHAPKVRQHPWLQASSTTLLTDTVRLLPDALFIPTGTAVEVELQRRVDEGLLSAQQVVSGFPHPSGANGHRRRMFDANKETMRATIARWR